MFPKRKSVKTAGAISGLVCVLAFAILYPRGTWPVSFDWREASGFKSASVTLQEHPLLSTILDFTVVPQAKPRIASEFRKAGWTSAQGTIYVKTLGAIPIVLVLDKTMEWRIVDPTKTLLMSAAEKEHLDEVRQLIASGANVNAHDQNGLTALMYATRSLRINPEIVGILLAAHAEVDATDRKGMTALAWAAADAAGVQVLHALLSAGADVDAKTNSGETPLMLAVVSGSDGQGAMESVKALIDAGADVHAIGSQGKTALALAGRMKRLQIAKFLERAAAKH